MSNGASTTSGGTTTNPSSPPPFIDANILSVTNGTSYLGALESVAVCTDRTCATPLSTATVTVNGTPLTYNTTRFRYEANFKISAGAALNLKVSYGGADYSASATQFSQFPTLLTPADGASVSGGAALPLSWTNGSPTTGAVNFVGVVDATGRLFYPATGNKPLELPIGSTSHTVPSNWTSIPGPYYVYDGIGTAGIGNSGGTGQAIPNAASGSGLKYGGIVQFSIVYAF